MDNKKDLKKFREYVIQQYPNISKAQLKELDKFVEEKETEQAVRAGVKTVDQVATKFPGLAAKLKEEGFPTAAEKKASQSQTQAKEATSVKEPAAEQKKLKGIVGTGLSSIDQIENILNTDPSKPGYEGKGELGKLMLPFGLGARQLRAEIDNLSDVVGRLRSGGAISGDEEKRFKRLLPDIRDDDATILRKLQRARSELRTVSGEEDFLEESLINPSIAPPTQIAAQQQRGGDFLSEFAKGIPATIGGGLGASLGGLAGVPLGPAGVIGGGIAGGSVGSLAGEGVRQLASGERDPQRFLTEGAFGALGGVGGQLLKGGARLGGKALTQALPESIMNRVFKEPIKDTRAAIAGGKQTLGKMALDRGEAGFSDEALYKTAVDKLNEFEGMLQQGLATSQRTIPISEIRASLSPVIKKYQGLGTSTARAAVKDVQDLLGYWNEYYKGAIPINIANEVKRGLYDEARNSYGRLASESIQATKATAKALKDSIAKKVPGVSKINEELSYHGRKADSLIEKLTKGGRAPFTDVKDWFAAAPGLVNPMTGLAGLALKKAGDSTAGRTFGAQALKKVGNVAQKVKTPINQALTFFGQAAPRLGAGLFGFGR